MKDLDQPDSFMTLKKRAALPLSRDRLLDQGWTFHFNCDAHGKASDQRRKTRVLPAGISSSSHTLHKAVDGMESEEGSHACWSHPSIHNGLHVTLPYTQNPQYGAGLCLRQCIECRITIKKRCPHMTHGLLRYYYSNWLKAYTLRLPTQSDLEKAVQMILQDGHRKLEYLQRERDGIISRGLDDSDLDQSDLDLPSSRLVALKGAILRQAEYIEEVRGSKTLLRLTANTESELHAVRGAFQLPFTDNEFDKIMESVKSDIDEYKISDRGTQSLINLGSTSATNAPYDNRQLPSQSRQSTEAIIGNADDERSSPPVATDIPHLHLAAADLPSSAKPGDPGYDSDPDETLAVLKRIATGKRRRSNNDVVTALQARIALLEAELANVQQPRALD